MGRRRDALVCRQMVELMTDYLEGALDPRDRARFDAHLDACPHCREYLAEMRAMISALGRIEPEALPEAVLDDLVVAFRAWRGS